MKWISPLLDAKSTKKIVSLNLIEFHCLCLCMCVLDHVWSCWVRYLWIFKDCRFLTFTVQVANLVLPVSWTVRQSMRSPGHPQQNCLIGVHCLFARLLPTLPKTSRLETYGNMGSNRSLQNQRPWCNPTSSYILYIVLVVCVVGPYHGGGH